MALQASLKAYGEERLVKDKEAGHIVGSDISARKRNRGTGKGQEKNVARDKFGIERGDTPGRNNARVPV